MLFGDWKFIQFASTFFAWIDLRFGKPHAVQLTEASTGNETALQKTALNDRDFLDGDKLWITNWTDHVRSIFFMIFSWFIKICAKFFFLMSRSSVADIHATVFIAVAISMGKFNSEQCKSNKKKVMTFHSTMNHAVETVNQSFMQ